MKAKNNIYEREKENTKVFFLLLGLFLFFLLLMYIIPLLQTIKSSFHEENINGDLSFVGFKNYEILLNQEAFLSSISNTIIIAILSSFLTISTSLWLAYILHYKIKSKPIRFLLLAFLILPSLLPNTAVAITWKYLLNYQYGLINILLSNLGLPAIQFLSSRIPSIFSLVIISSWRDIGYTLLMFFAAFKTIPINTLFLSDIDGCSIYESFKFIILPLISKFILFTFGLSIISTLKMYDLVSLVLGEKSAFLLNSNTVLSLFYKYTYSFRDKGISAAIVVISTILVCFVLFIIQLTRKKTTNEKME